LGCHPRPGFVPASTAGAFDRGQPGRDRSVAGRASRPAGPARGFRPDTRRAGQGPPGRDHVGRGGGQKHCEHDPLRPSRARAAALGTARGPWRVSRSRPISKSSHRTWRVVAAHTTRQDHIV
jgi:hypothetical protein